MLSLLLLACHWLVVEGLPVYCSSPGKVCQTGDNLLGLQSGVDTEGECLQLCRDTDRHIDGDSFPVRSVCLMFSSCGVVLDSEDARAIEAIIAEWDRTGDRPARHAGLRDDRP